MIEKQVLISYYHIIDYQIFTVKTRSIISNNFCIPTKSTFISDSADCT